MGSRVQWSGLVWLLAGWTAIASAQVNPSTGEFVRNHPGVRLYGSPFHRPADAADESRPFGAVYGTVLAVGATPLESATSHLHEIEPLLGDQWGELQPVTQASGEILLPLMPRPGGGEPRFYTLRFDQYFDGLPVFRSGVGLLIRNEPGNPVVASGVTVRNLPGFSAGGVDPATVRVTRAMLDNVDRLLEAGGEAGLKSVLKGPRELTVKVTDVRMVIYAGTSDESAPPQVAVEFMFQRGSVKTWPDYWKYRFVAALTSGQLLVAEDQIQDVNVTGNIQGRATNGLGSLECHPEVARGLPYAEATVTGGNTAFADVSGNFNIPHGGSSQVNVRSRLRGRWFEVFDQSAGGAIPELNQLVTPPGPAGFLHNPVNNQEFPTANVNAYLEANVVRDYVLGFQPAFPVIGTQAFFDINTNINDNCNAFYDGGSINFFRAGGGCNNTSMSDVIYHEYGHHLVNVTSNGQGQFGEGTGDVAGVLIQDEPVLAHGFDQNCGAGIRTASNSIQFPCSGSIHFCGQLISGAVWETRNQLAITEPSGYRDVGASLFFGMLIARGQMDPFNSTIDPFITILYLELDDDDADINNGTPHYDEIAAGFGLHNLDAPELSLLDFDYPNGRPELVSPVGGVAFEVVVEPISQQPAPGTARLFVNAGSGFQEYTMNETSPNVYEASFPPGQCGDVVAWYVSAQAANGFTQVDPPGAPMASYQAILGTTLTIGFSDNFETHTGWFESGNSSDGLWERGVPVGGGDRGDPPTDSDGSGQCLLTGNLDGDSDVDNGYTTAYSPIMNAIGPPGSVAFLTYSRWYSNSEGANPESDIFEVQLSNDGGTSLTILEIVGPGGPEVHGGWITRSYRISDVMTPTDRMRIGFKASDYNGGSIVEAGVDAVSLRFVSCEETPVTPEGRKVLDGMVVGGQLSDIFTSDDVYLQLENAPTSNPAKQKIHLIVQSTSPLATPSVLRFRVEAGKNGGPVGDVIQTLRLMNYQTRQFEAVDTRPASNTDTVVEVNVTGDPARFVQPLTREITADMTWASPVFSGPPFTWSLDLDQAVWIIE